MGSAILYGRSGITAAFVPNHDNGVKGQSVNVIGLCNDLGMEENDINKLWQSFQKCDLKKRGALKVSEFLVMNQISNKTFGKLVFGIFDLDGSKDISFEEFIITVWNCLTLDDKTLPLFAFRLFDQDASGVLTIPELQNMIKVICGGNEQSIQAATAFMKTGDKNKDDMISYSEFENMCHRSKIVLFPAFSVVQALRGKIMGGGRWDHLATIRRKKFGEMFLLDIMNKIDHKPEGYLRQMTNSISGFKLRTQKVADAPVEKKKVYNKLEIAHEKLVAESAGLKFDAQRYENDSDDDDEEKEHKKGPSSKHKKTNHQSNLLSPSNQPSPTNKFHKDAKQENKIKTPYNIPTLVPPKEFTAKERAVAAAIAAEGGPELIPPIKELPLLEVHHPNALAALNGAAMTKKAAAATNAPPPDLAKTLSRFQNGQSSPRQGVLVGTFFNGQEKEKMEEVAQYVFERNKAYVEEHQQVQRKSFENGFSFRVNKEDVNKTTATTAGTSKQTPTTSSASTTPTAASLTARSMVTLTARTTASSGNKTKDASEKSNLSNVGDDKRVKRNTMTEYFASKEKEKEPPSPSHKITTATAAAGGGGGGDKAAPGEKKKKHKRKTLDDFASKYG